MRHRPVAAWYSVPLLRFSALLLLAGLAFGACAVPAAAGPIGWGVSGGWFSDGDDDFLLGAGARFGLGPVTVIPNAEYIFVDSGSSYTLNVDGTMNVIPLGVATGWVGGGLGFFTVDPEHVDANTETAVNLLVGAGLNATRFKPYGQIKYMIMDGDDPFVFSVGVRF